MLHRDMLHDSLSPSHIIRVINQETWDKHWREKNAYSSLVGTLERTWHRWKDYIK
jgi:hypothetical protein